MNRRIKKKRKNLEKLSYSELRDTKRKDHERTLALSRMYGWNYWSGWTRGYPNRSRWVSFFTASNNYILHQYRNCLNGENVDRAAVEAYKVRTAELLGVNLIQSTQWKERLEKAQQMENAEFLKLVDKVEAKRWLKDVLTSSAFAKYEPTKNKEDFEK